MFEDLFAIIIYKILFSVVFLITSAFNALHPLKSFTPKHLVMIRLWSFRQRIVLLTPTRIFLRLCRGGWDAQGMRRREL